MTFSRLRCWILAPCLLAAAGSSAAWAQAPVAAFRVVDGEVAPHQTYIGTIHPRRRSVIGSAVDGRVVAFDFEKGDPVKKGNALAQLRTGTLEIQIKAAKAELRVRQQEHTELKNGSRPEEIEQAKARMERAEAVLKYAQARHRRIETLSERGQVVTQEEFDSSLSALARAQQDLIESKSAYQLAVEGPRKEKIAQAKERVAVQQEVVNELQDKLVKHTIVAPFDGYVVSEHTQVGEWVEQSQAVAEVIELAEVELEVFVPQDWISRLHVGANVTVLVRGMDGPPFFGTVHRVVPQADVRARTFPVIVRVSNREEDGQHVLKSGMLAEAKLPLGKPRKSLLIPKDALVLGGKHPLVYIVETKSKDAQEGTVVQVPVQVGVAKDALVSVEASLKPGDVVVVLGNERLRPNQQVRITQWKTPDDYLEPASPEKAPLGDNRPAGQ